MALFEGTVAFVMISASMKSMDPALEESARVMGASKFRTILTVTLPLVMPGVMGASLFVFAEMLGSFAAALVLGIPGRIYVITTAIWDSTLAYPPDYGRASAMGLSLFIVMFAMLTLYRRMIRRGTFTTISGKEIEGLTGGALDANEGDPGSFYIQGDHTGGLKFRNVTVSVPK